MSHQVFRVGAPEAGTVIIIEAIDDGAPLSKLRRFQLQ
jgi:hypothetical protein